MHANADRLGIVNIEVPDILCGECEPAVPANRKFVCLEQLRIGAEGYRSRSLTGLRPHTRGLRGKTIALRPEGKTDERTVPIELHVLGGNREPFGKAGVLIGWEWREGGFHWEEDVVRLETDEKGFARFLWTPPACFESAETCWKLPEKTFSLVVVAHRQMEGEDGFTGCRVTNGAPVVLSVEPGEYRLDTDGD